MKAPEKSALDAIVFDANKPNAYIDSFAIGLKGNQKP
jgi:hypothetical protein